jgi:GTP-binding protein
MPPVVAIVGRPNVGKSTLFNRLSRSRDAIVNDFAGTTRDRLYAAVVYDDTPLTLVDTGGFDDMDRDPLMADVRRQVETAIQEADRVIFLVDGRQGLLPADEAVADLLRRFQKKVVLAVNKVDGPEHEPLITDFYRLGLDAVFPVSAAHGYGVKGLMEALIRDLPGQEAVESEQPGIRVAVLGRPNAGKSSLINRILGMDRLLVSETPGTTRDAVDTAFSYRGRDYVLIDTAGIRRRGKVRETIEKFSVIKALKGLDRCHVAVVLLDGAEGVSDQDARICGYALERGRGIVLALNKWDLVKGDAERRKGLAVQMERRLEFLSFAPRIHLSALTGERVMKLLPLIDRVYDQFSTRAQTSTVNSVLRELMEKHPPPRAGRGRVKFLYATQARSRPPTFVIFVNYPELVHVSYRRFVMNQLQTRLGLEYTPVRLLFRKR